MLTLSHRELIMALGFLHCGTVRFRSGADARNLQNAQLLLLRGLGQALQSSQLQKADPGGSLLCSAVNRHPCVPMPPSSPGAGGPCLIQVPSQPEQLM
jgi:hypothetical protein